ncbi:Glucuronoxylan 4-O-methyltransferase 2 [Hibiscus syriacus]|uniref:Glucuronoxylan 4-O-methyltransferase 2 n=1 Tax=Hibiscus syriacus TaxID=106335 RepID=A0A6A3B388_HIBSY|nr:glucuronoxylan 4-O-methyltransferase 3-like [Hibiscus syriacus]KAE8709795.1 Glucuronoxylan 4-O-methyltransferase 2 [Hibiscus syriacus]
MRSNAKPQSPSPFNTKLILICSFFLLFLLLVFGTTSSTFSTQQRRPPSASIAESQVSNSTPCPSLPSCTKAPPSLATALIHYATTNTTPQQTFKEISVSARVIETKSPCNFLVFGLGHDSLMWAALNHGGRTVFLEEDKAWIDQMKQKFPGLESYHVEYSTKVHQSDALLETGTKEESCRVVSDPRSSKCELAHKGFPSEIYDVEWDLIMVDAPTGFHDEAAGRMNAIYTAGLMARNREEGETDVFVHDVNRAVEDKFSKAFLCEGYLREQQGLLRHFTIPSHRAGSARLPFCP